MSEEIPREDVERHDDEETWQVVSPLATTEVVSTAMNPVSLGRRMMLTHQNSKEQQSFLLKAFQSQKESTEKDVYPDEESKSQTGPIHEVKTEALQLKDDDAHLNRSSAYSIKVPVSSEPKSSQEDTFDDSTAYKELGQTKDPSLSEYKAFHRKNSNPIASMTRPREDDEKDAEGVKNISLDDYKAFHRKNSNSQFVATSLADSSDENSTEERLQDITASASNEGKKNHLTIDEFDFTHLKNSRNDMNTNSPTESVLEEAGSPTKLLQQLDKEKKKQDTKKKRSKWNLAKDAPLVLNAKGVLKTIEAIGLTIFTKQSAQHLTLYLLIAFAMISESSIPAPSYNVPIGSVLLMCRSSFYRKRSVVSGLWLATLLDVFWLLRRDEFDVHVNVNATIKLLARLSLVLCAMFKLVLIFSVYSQLEPSRVKSKAAVSRSSCWAHQVKYFFPRQTLPLPSDLSYEVMRRIVALVWMHAIAGFSLLFLGLFAAVAYSASSVFQHSPFGLPLNVMMLLKAGTTLVTVLLTLSRIQIGGCLWLCGCPLSSSLPEQFQYNRNLPIIMYKKKWVKTILWLKLVDFVVGLYLMVVLYTSIHQAEFFFHGVLAMLVSTIFISLAIDLWSPLLIIVVIRCGKALSILYTGEDDDHIYFPDQLDELSESELDSEDDEDEEEDEDDNDDDSDEDDDDDSDEDDASEVYKNSKDRMNYDERVDIHLNVVHPESSSNALWSRHWDEYGRAFLTNERSGETIWDWQGDHDASQHYIDYGLANSAGSPLSCDIYLTMEEFGLLWTYHVPLGGYTCYVKAIPTIQSLLDHLACYRFWVVSHDCVDGHWLRVYFYAHLVESADYFLSEFIFDTNDNSLRVTFKCKDPVRLPEFVHLLRLKDVIGDYYAAVVEPE